MRVHHVILLTLGFLLLPPGSSVFAQSTAQSITATVRIVVPPKPGPFEAMPPEAVQGWQSTRIDEVTKLLGSPRIAKALEELGVDPTAPTDQPLVIEVRSADLNVPLTEAQMLDAIRRRTVSAPEGVPASTRVFNAPPGYVSPPRTPIVIQVIDSGNAR